jgi:trehalose/maltose hydrolase-like predicted phosphorylase
MAVSAAISCATKLGYTPPQLWKKIVKSICIPMDKKKNIILPYDLDSLVRVYNSKYRIFEEVSATRNLRTYSLGNLHFLFIHNCPVDRITFRNTYFHEEQIRLTREPEGGVPGSTGAPGFTSPPYAVCAAFFGERKKAAEFFRNTWKPHWLEPFGMTLEHRLQDYGSYITAFGSLLQSVILGFTGLRIREGNWITYRASLPAGWKKIEIDRIWVRGKAMKLVAVHGRKTKLQAVKARPEST